MSTVTDVRTFESFANNDPIVVDATKNIVAVTGNPTAQTAAATHGAIGARTHTGVVGGEAIQYGCGAVGGRSVYGNIRTAGTGTATVIAVKNGSTFLARIRVNPSGTQWELTNFDGSSVLDTTTIDYAVGQDFRLDMLWNYSGGNITVTCRIYQGANIEGYVPDETLGPNNFPAAAIPNRFHVGTVNTAWAIDFDTIREYSDDLSWPQPYVSTAAASQRPVATISNTGWTVTGAASAHAALADESDTSYIQSAAAGTSTIREWMGPGITPDTAQLLVRGDVTASSAGVQSVRIIQGTNPGVTLETIVIPLTTTTANYSPSFASGTVSAITNWQDLYLEPVWVP